jgi:hypothetical protein
MAGERKKIVYYCGHCEPRPEDRKGVEIIIKNHDVCVMRVALPILENISGLITGNIRKKR